MSLTVIVNESPSHTASPVKLVFIVKLGKGATSNVFVTKVELHVPLKAIRPKVESVDIVPAVKLYKSPVATWVAPIYQ